MEDERHIGAGAGLLSRAIPTLPPPFWWLSPLSLPLFIVFEGIDGSGTTTQCRSLQRYIEQHLRCPVVATREPGGTSAAEQIRQLVLDPDLVELDPLAELLLYAAGRAQHVRERIKPALAAGTPVLCDRYTASSVAYQGFGRGLAIDLVEKVNAIAIGDCRADITIFLDLPVEEAQARCSDRGEPRDRLEMEGIDLQKRVRAAYLEIAERTPKVSLLIDSRPPAGEIGDEILHALKHRWPGFPFK